MNPIIMSVSQLNRYVKSLLEGDSHLANVYVSGEISNFKLHSLSGHAYFSLKDNDSLINCVCFRANLDRLRFTPSDGMTVLCQGRISLYEKSGNYQLYVVSMRPEGIGELALSYEQLKAKLEGEGLFDPARKRPLPSLPRKIAVVTARDGAAVRDIFNILERRYPLCEPILCPALVQGADAASDMTAVLKRVYRLPDLNLIILGRGGGASEDLGAFNDETLVRTVAASPVPIISAVGHETDVTLCDFAADFRAPTPSAAAECAVPDQNDLKSFLRESYRRLGRGLDRKYTDAALRFDAVTRSGILSNWDRVVSKNAEKLSGLHDGLRRAFENNSISFTNRLSSRSAELDALSPLKTLARGFAVAEKDGKIVRSVNELSAEETFSLRFADGQINGKVI